MILIHKATIISIHLIIIITVQVITTKSCRVTKVLFAERTAIRIDFNVLQD